MARAKMTCVDWVKLLGRTTEDASFVAILKANGFARVPRADSPNKTIDGMSLCFCHPAGLRAKIATTKETTAALFGVMLHLNASKLSKSHYTGPLPLELESNDSLASLTKKLGKPRSQNAKEARVRWQLDRFDVVALYSSPKDLETLKALSFVLPYA